MSDDERYEYDERVAICTAEGIKQRRAEEIARQQVEADRTLNETNK